MNRATRTLRWKLCCAAMVLLSVLTFLPLVTPAGQFEPTLAGLPRTLWAGVLIALGMLALTYVGARVHPGGDADRDDT